jgi:hypothetical protein
MRRKLTVGRMLRILLQIREDRVLLLGVLGFVVVSAVREE